MEGRARLSLEVEGFADVTTDRGEDRLLLGA